MTLLEVRVPALAAARAHVATLRPAERGRGRNANEAATMRSGSRPQPANVVSGRPRTPSILTANTAPESGACARACSLRRTAALAT